MASELQVDELKGVTTDGDITITNGTTTQKLQDGVVNTYSLYDQQNTNVDISLNVGSITDNGTGDYIVNFSNNFNVTKEYIVSHGSQDWYDNGGTSDSILYSDSNTTTGKIRLYHWENTTQRDTQYLSLSLIGDLA